MSVDNIGRGALPHQYDGEPDDNDVDQMETCILERELEFCGCGLPTEAVVELHHYLAALANKWEEYDPHQFDAVTDNRGKLYLLHYMLCEKGLTEHGGSVPGWLTDKGWQLFLYTSAYMLQHTKDFAFDPRLNIERLNEEVRPLPWLNALEGVPALTNVQMDLLYTQFQKQGFDLSLFDEYIKDNTPAE